MSVTAYEPGTEGTHCGVTYASRIVSALDVVCAHESDSLPSAQIGQMSTPEISLGARYHWDRHTLVVAGFPDATYGLALCDVRTSWMWWHSSYALALLLRATEAAGEQAMTSASLPVR